MPTQLIPAPNNPYGLPLIAGQVANECVAIECVVAAGATVGHGDAVSLVSGASADAVSVQRSTAANDKTYLGTAVVSAPNASSGQQGQTLTSPAAGQGMLQPVRVVLQGVVKANVGANTPAVGDIMATSTTAGVLVTNNAATVGQAAGICLQTKDANNQILLLQNKS